MFASCSSYGAISPQWAERSARAADSLKWDCCCAFLLCSLSREGNQEVNSSVCRQVLLCSNLKDCKIIKTAYCPFYVMCSFPEACITHNAA